MKLDKLVIGIDFSTASVEAAGWTAHHFAPGAELVLVHVISIPEAPSQRQEVLTETMREGAEKRLRELSLSLNAGRVWLEIREGNAVECLNEVAAAFSADIIIAGAHGERARIKDALGTTAEKLVRTAPCPVLLHAGAGSGPPSHILVPVDKSDNVGEALRWAGMLSGRLGSRVTAIHVVTAGIASGALAAATILSGTPPIDPPVQGATAEMPDRWLESVVAAGVPRDRANSEVAFGEPTREVLNAVERLGADLIVMGRRGEGKFRRAVLGSVVDGVLRASTCPVLVVPAPSDAHE